MAGSPQSAIKKLARILQRIHVYLIQPTKSNIVSIKRLIIGEACCEPINYITMNDVLNIYEELGETHLVNSVKEEMRKNQQKSLTMR